MKLSPSQLAGVLAEKNKAPKFGNLASQLATKAPGAPPAAMPKMPSLPKAPSPLPTSVGAEHRFPTIRKKLGF